MHAWETQRDLPRNKYILLHGILREGLILFIIIKLLQFLIQRDGFTVFYTSYQGVLFLFLEIIFWTFGGYVIGWFKRNRNEIEYELLKYLSE